MHIVRPSDILCIKIFPREAQLIKRLDYAEESKTIIPPIHKCAYHIETPRYQQNPPTGEKKKKHEYIHITNIIIIFPNYYIYSLLLRTE